MQCLEPAIVSEYLSNELKLNRVIKLSKLEASQLKIYCSPFGLIPKKNKPGKWRLIVDLSAPEGSSVNDGIEKDMISLLYTSVDTIVHRVVQLGQGTHCPRWTSNRPTGSFPSTQMIDIYWAWSGKGQSMWTNVYLSGSDQLRYYSQQWRMHCNG